MCGTAMRGAVTLPGSKATSRAKGSYRNLGGVGSGRQRRVSLVALLVAGVCIGSNKTSLAEPVTIDLTHWTPPDIGTVGDDPFGNLVKYGHGLFTDTPNEIGPGVSDTAKRFAGNNLACQNCHLQAGTQPYAMPMSPVCGQFPQYRGREGAVELLEGRINGWRERSVKGT